MTFARHLFAALLLGLSFATAPLPAHARDDAADKPVVVFAAASLKNALDAVAREWTGSSGVEVKASYAASSALARQLEQDAPADLFISADTAWMDYVADKKLIATDSRLDLLGNRLVLVAGSDWRKGDVDLGPGFDLSGALGAGRLAMGDVNSVPAGRYGKAALTSLGLWESVASRVAGAENVRAALALVARGEAPLGVVYRTDAAADPSVRIVGTFPADSHPAIVYPAARLATSDNGQAAAFLKYLASAPARKTFEAAGFAVLAPASGS